MDYQLLPTTEQTVTTMLSLIRSAKKEVLIQFMTFEADNIGLEFISAIEEKISEGVKVKLMTDGYTFFSVNDRIIYTPHFPKRFIADFKEMFATKKRFKKLKDLGAIIKIINPKSIFKPHLLAKHDHRKIVAVDGETAIIGGFNVSDHNYSWHDTAVVIKEKLVVDKIMEIFNLNIEKDNDGEPYYKLNDEIEIFQNNKLIMDRLTRLCIDAKKRIYIESGYLRDEKLINLIYDRFLNGLDCKIIVSSKSNKWLHQRIKNTQIKKYPGLFVKRTAPKEMTHAKLALVDETCIFGSSNFEYSDLVELSIFLKDESLTDQFTNYFLLDIDQASKSNAS